MGTRKKSIFKFENVNGATTVFGRGYSGRVVSSNGFAYSQYIANNIVGKKILVLGGGIGWMAYNIAGKLFAKDPYNLEGMSVTSVELDPGMIEHTPEIPFPIPVHIVHMDALDFIKGLDKDEYDTVIVDLYETDLDTVRIPLEVFRKLAWYARGRIIVHLIRPDDIIYYLKIGHQLDIPIGTNDELFGAEGSELEKKLTFSSSGADLMFLMEEGKRKGDFVYWARDFDLVINKETVFLREKWQIFQKEVVSFYGIKIK